MFQGTTYLQGIQMNFCTRNIKDQQFIVACLHVCRESKNEGNNSDKYDKTRAKMVETYHKKMSTLPAIYRKKRPANLLEVPFFWSFTDLQKLFSEGKTKRKKQWLDAGWKGAESSDHV